MKDELLTIIFMFSFLTGCHSQVNTSDAQVSRSAKDSKSNGVYVNQYVIDSTTDSLIIVEEVWVEKMWFYELHHGKAVKVPQRACQLCFKIKQTPNLKYSFKNLGKWLMEYPAINRYVGSHYESNKGIYKGVYVLNFNDCLIPDIIPLDLIEETDTGDKIIKTKVGMLVFKAKSLLKADGK